MEDADRHVRVEFTPTVQHCSMATLIGLCVRVKLLRCLPPRFKARPAANPTPNPIPARVGRTKPPPHTRCETSYEPRKRMILVAADAHGECSGG